MNNIKIYYLPSEEVGEDYEGDIEQYVINHPKSEVYSLEDFIVAYNEESLSNLAYIAVVYPKEMTDTINYVTIPIIQLASDLAHNAARDEMWSNTSIGYGFISNEEEM